MILQTLYRQLTLFSRGFFSEKIWKKFSAFFLFEKVVNHTLPVLKNMI